MLNINLGNLGGMKEAVHIYHIMSVQICARQASRKSNSNIGSYWYKLNEAVLLLVVETNSLDNYDSVVYNVNRYSGIWCHGKH